MKSALLVLADGTFYQGQALGWEGESIGEVVFNTSMSGYQEILTDPSYRGQLVTMTANHIGNYGCNDLDVESDRVQVSGLIVREASRRASNYRSTATLDEYLVANRTVAIAGVDTRAVTRRIREGGATMGAIVHGATAADVPAIVERIRSAPQYDDQDFVAATSVREPMRVHLRETGDAYHPHLVELVSQSTAWPAGTESSPHVVVLDYGVKRSILEQLASTGVRITLVPHDTTAEGVLALEPDGIMLSNGPGDPARLEHQVAQIRELLGKRPVFGICLGHQLLSQAVGGSTFKLVYGHRGPNQPVMDRDTGRVEITAQNHGYAVRFDDAADVEVTHVNLNDQTVEGIRVASLNAFSVQHHPEAGPGPHDSVAVFSRFRSMLQAS